MEYEASSVFVCVLCSQEKNGHCSPYHPSISFGCRFFSFSFFFLYFSAWLCIVFYSLCCATRDMLSRVCILSAFVWLWVCITIAYMCAQHSLPIQFLCILLSPNAHIALSKQILVQLYISHTGRTQPHTLSYVCNATKANAFAKWWRSETSTVRRVAAFISTQNKTEEK